MRGEKTIRVHFIRYKSGSPPHARGKVNKYNITIFDRWITPACAGKSV